MFLSFPLRFPISMALFPSNSHIGGLSLSQKSKNKGHRRRLAYSLLSNGAGRKAYRKKKKPAYPTPVECQVIGFHDHNDCPDILYFEGSGAAGRDLVIKVTVHRGEVHQQVIWSSYYKSLYVIVTWLYNLSTCRAYFP